MNGLKTAIIVLETLPTWQKLNVTAFLATGIGDASPNAMGEIYHDAADRPFTRLFGEPIVIFTAPQGILVHALNQALTRDLTRAAYVDAMFFQPNGEAGRAVFRREPLDAPNLVGLALRGPRNEVNGATKGARLHT
ncbi:DUF2000 domain-containing protein [Acidiphilium sp. JA12-A1]|uniref:DUF2000 domain-containing protein n=1 Tax=Acidiphilium sp. JA12-A1 TaxID=1464546 RepID=UPI000461520C|nr:DUF2000 domain-containing protein [Acidiphilium sp. JA12-A1]KDM66082.1 hypothetical protein ACIDI_71c00220 [Acidiphilium sp. JA12-A1]